MNMLTINKALTDFIKENINADVNKLLLSAKKNKDLSFDLTFAVDQIKARKQIKDKLPQWYACDDIIIPSRISAEQCSSEYTAGYKADLVKGDSLCDLTGGMGVDCFYMSRNIKSALYIERFEEYCQCAVHNFRALKTDNIKVLNNDSRDALDEIKENIDTFYIDPARRSDVNKRLFALEDCEPDIVSLKATLLQKAKRVIVKTSPMADIDMTIRLLPETKEVHVLSVKNECKELVFILENNEEENNADEKELSSDIKITCVNFLSDKEKETFVFYHNNEKEIGCQYCDDIKGYLYEPNSSVMKAGAFKSICLERDLRKLHINSHLYCSETYTDDFPGRKSEIVEVLEFSSKSIKGLNKRFPKANITVRNFPLSVDELRKKTGIKDGGDTYIFATISGDKKLLLVCRKVINDNSGF